VLHFQLVFYPKKMQQKKVQANIACSILIFGSNCSDLKLIYQKKLEANIACPM
jgi:hypothetical protein